MVMPPTGPVYKYPLPSAATWLVRELGWVISAEVKPALAVMVPHLLAVLAIVVRPTFCAAEPPTWYVELERSARIASCNAKPLTFGAPPPKWMHCGQVPPCAPPGVFRNVLITRWPPIYGCPSGPKVEARLTPRPLLPMPPQNTVLASGTKKPGLSGLAGSPGLPSGSMHAQICCELRRLDTAMANWPSALTDAAISFSPSGMSL